MEVIVISLIILLGVVGGSIAVSSLIRVIASHGSEVQVSPQEREANQTVAVRQAGQLESLDHGVG